jgi:methionyl-tRNA formyltransferase
MQTASRVMRIGYFGDGPWSHLGLQRIIETPGLEIAFIVARFDRGDPILRSYAERLGVEYLLHPKVNSPEFVEHISKFGADLLVSLSFDQILGPEILSVAPLGFINCHAGALPFYRGRNILNWVLINGENRFGVTVHYVDAGIDTGDIIVQRFAEIRDEDDYATLLARAIPLCAEALLEALILIQKGQAPRILQTNIHPIGTYCSRRIPGDEYLDWNWSSRRIHNFVRGLATPGPLARIFHRGKELAIVKTELIPDAPAYVDKVGMVVGRAPGHVTVKTGDATIRVRAISRVADDGKISEPEMPTFSIGTRLTIDLGQRVRDLELRLSALEQAATASPSQKP